MKLLKQFEPNLFMKSLNKTETPISYTLCVLCVQRQPLRFLLVVRNLDTRSPLKILNEFKPDLVVIVFGWISTKFMLSCHSDNLVDSHGRKIP